MAIPVINDDPSRCMKCGFCMSVCPVYDIDKKENHVARGRNVLLLLARSGSMRIETIEDVLFYCMLCGKCEAVCPAKVSCTTIAMNARNELAEKKGISLLKRIIFKGILKNRKIMAWFAKFASHIPGFSSKESVRIRHFPDFISMILKGISVPRFSVPFLSGRVPEKTQAAVVPARGKIAVFGGCITEFFLPHTGERMISSLAEAGYEVHYPKEQTCCGLPVYGSGDFETAKKMARRNIDTLSQYDFIITGCASCGSTLKGYAHWLEGDSYMDKAAAFSKKVKDFSEFITGAVKFKPALKSLKVTYHDPCHLKWKQGISTEPREILKNIPGVEFVEMEGADNCCGLGGSFALMHPEESVAIQKKKIESIKKTGADIVVTACPGCMIQIMDGLRRENLRIDVMHISQMI